MATLGVLPNDVGASFERIVALIEVHGIERMREPYLKHLEGARFEKAHEGPLWHCPRCLRHGSRQTDRGGACIRQESAEDTATGDRYCPQTGQGGDMKRQFLPVEEAFNEWRKFPEYVAAYEALGDEFALASALIKARGEAGMTQEQVASAMGTNQAYVARPESGKGLPSTRTLERFAKATNTRLRINFEPEKPRHDAQR